MVKRALLEAEEAALVNFHAPWSDSEDDGEDGAAVAEDFGPYQQRAVPVSAIINHTKEVVFKVR